ncbi:hypothetical protein TcCL_NonESM11548 [Trypanosoma cruzi]|nr:hypothetical protein TcCL_NonESM11548 [Trypanosoma cruzi]
MEDRRPRSCKQGRRQGATCAVRDTRVALQRHGGVMPRWEHRCRPAHHVREELLLPLSREEKRPQRPNDERSPAPPRSTYRLCRQKDADDALLRAWQPLNPSQ